MTEATQATKLDPIAELEVLLANLRDIDAQIDELTARRRSVLLEIEHALNASLFKPEPVEVVIADTHVAAVPVNLTPKSATSPRSRTTQQIIMRTIMAFPGNFTSKELYERVQAMPDGEGITLNRVCAGIAVLKVKELVEKVGDTEGDHPLHVYRMALPRMGNPELSLSAHERMGGEGAEGEPAKVRKPPYRGRPMKRARKVRKVGGAVHA